MNKTFSLYLDLVRFVAAVMVVMTHTNYRWVIEWVVPASSYAHTAVIVFFVLSGFVISYVTEVRENTVPDYAASRIARIYSVALPAIILTPILDYFTRTLTEGLGRGSMPSDWVAIRVLASATFTNELWFASIMSFSNMPYWSLCYEVWYYIGFGVWFFSRGQMRRWLVGAVMLIVGPKILLLAPVWGMGVLLNRWRPLKSPGEAIGWGLVIASVLGIVVFHKVDVAEACAKWLESMIGTHWYRQLAGSRWFIGDYLLGALVTIHFAGMRAVAHRLGGLLDPARKLIQGLAAYTFTLYVLHVPLFLFWTAVLRGDPRQPWFYLSTITLIGLSVFAIGYYPEKKRHALRNWLAGVFSRPLVSLRARRSVP